ncbi:ribosomal protein S0 [Hamiltosporidium magnivora]|uniref:Small ribosomal subunit protein uS2 n=1 Tax=Hamiltosporidium magnivora TaxID=148818 RepID=A0A4Q9KUQ9_9MICR|nr:ribosomal protein S0 [Hamiltosporidium magnivora]TBT98010.1 ribosomal protein S0 [Hamiltosporidium magnivora]
MKQPVIPIPDEIVNALIGCSCHLGGTNCTNYLRKYIFGQRPDDKIHVIDIPKMWKKLILAARMFVAVENPKNVIVVSNKNFGRRAVLKFCETTGATPITGRFIPGSFTNQEIKGVREPRLVLVSDPFADKQTVAENSYINTPCIAFTNTDNEISFVDVAIPMNNRSPLAIGAGFFILSRLIGYMQGKISLIEDINNQIELFFYRDPVELEMLVEENKNEESAGVKMQDDISPVDDESVTPAAL